MEKSANLNLPYIAAAQAQKHVTLNEALTMLDALVQMSVASRQLTSPPATPERGERFVVPDHAIGDWANHGNDIAMWDEDAWVFLSPQAGWRAFIEDEAADYLFDDGWRRPAPAVNPVDKIGVNTLADGANKLSVKSDAVLFSHDDVSPGTGGVRHALNKAGASNTRLRN